MKAKIFILLIYFFTAYFALLHGQNPNILLEAIKGQQESHDLALNLQQSVINHITQNLDLCQAHQLHLAMEVRIYAGVCVFLGAVQTLQLIATQPENSLIHRFCYKIWEYLEGRFRK